MTTVTIAYEVSDAAVEKIEALLDNETTFNPNFAGEVFSIERGDFTCIDADDYEYVGLLNAIFDIIDN
ncbi:hypothetical protein ACS91J_04575 [Pectobacterium carotovorum]